MSLFRMSPLISVEWLASRRGSKNLIVLDATLKPVGSAAPFMNTMDREQIPGTRVFDFDKKICDPNSALPHMMPAPQIFEREARSLGINQDSIIVVYDRVGTYSSPRAWWMLKSMGHEHVGVLDGGFPAWVAAGYATEPVSAFVPAPGNFVARAREGNFYNADQVAVALNDSNVVVLDARSEGRFLGREPEPRVGLRSGHMPNAVNLPFHTLQRDGRMRSLDELREILAAKVKPDQKLVTSCGSGVTACIITLAAELVGHKECAVYDGSWSEWGLPSKRPVES